MKYPLISSFFVGLALVLTSPSAHAKWLLSAQEAEYIGKSPAMQEPMAAQTGIGPKILVSNPKFLSSVTPPVDISVAFTPGQSGHNPDMESLKVVVVGFFDFDITDRVREYLEGTHLNVKDAAFPVGRHRIRMRIKDEKGNANEKDLIVTVSPQQN
ncbi:conserved exported hypothetical protein [Candidatus Terasakiella magnetica]|uniref:Uncharacterized protein n=1 Tax=Candidatus Terasakiella magnetica TaxID=1867952 RepID=A0A1C3RHV3_9PROT|nr:hypothetical protein [Candidatus Terasakiella magnetica]SCA56861.1 conserved exported hypothetical protein [Candidatus Terasakiella magnetica]